MLKQTALHSIHQQSGALLVDFAGWDMPLHYGSQLNEHHIVRKNVGMFDVSHMTAVDLSGEKATAFLRYLLANDVAKLKAVGKALYTCMLNEQGCVIDDLIVYKSADNDYRLVVNAGTTEKDLAWLNQHAKQFNVTVTSRRDLSIIAVQGPHALHKVQSLLNDEHVKVVENLTPFSAVKLDGWMIARTGYTGEEGYEILLPHAEAVKFWQQLEKAGVVPCGLGARDTLRLEAGYNLYGQDMDETTTPLETNLTWTVALQPSDRNFIGRQVLESQKVTRNLVAIVLQERGVLRHEQKVMVPGVGEGIITSGSFSPTLQMGIAFALLPIGVKTECFVEIRNKQMLAKIIKGPFVKNGKRAFEVAGEKVL